mmetsp:Transcript_21165/g.36373  ORF Transcript_21165/g.36373 Transcript_21165/m.36373 type:complete len:121 (-) Transcript_21165:1890-2252(-)
MRPEEQPTIVVPNAFTKLRACLSCSLVKTMGQFHESGCENCPFLSMGGDTERVQECTTTAFQGMYCLIKPQDSWVAKFQMTVRLIPGCYAISVDGKLPEPLEDEIRELGNRVRQIRANMQ